MASVSEPTYPTISVLELRTILTLASQASATVAQVLELRDLFDRLVILANQTHPIGAVVPRGVSQLPEGKQAESDPSGEALSSSAEA